jgi:broad-specificity NMP kinase
MKRSIFVTGMPGVGKSTLSRTLGSLGYYVWDLEEVPNLYESVNPHTGEKVVRDNAILEQVMNSEWICDANLLKAIIGSQKTDVAFYFGRAANEEDLIPLFTDLVMLQASPETLHKRLSTRNIKEFGGVPEVREWSVSWKDWWEGETIRRGAVVIDAEPSTQEVARALLSQI